MLEHLPQLNITQSELTPPVADYFDNLLAQRDAILERYGLTPETAEEFCDLRSSDEERETMLALYEKMVYVIERKEIPPWEKIFIHIVPDAINPYADAYKEAGLPDDHPLCHEQKEMTIDIPEIIAFQTTHYRSQGMETWANDIEQHIDQLYDQLSSHKEQQRIEMRIKAGYIPIIMPSRKTQLADWEHTLQELKPIYYKEGVNIDIIEPSINRDVFLPKMTDPLIDPHHSFFRDIPERPYLIWTKPIAVSHKETDPAWQIISLAFAQQEKYLETLHKNHPELCDITDITPLEYAALQSIYTETIRHSMHEQNANIEDITPLDWVGWTRFIAGGSLSNGCVLSACFNSGNFQLIFGQGSAAPLAWRGFRPVART